MKNYIHSVLIVLSFAILSGCQSTIMKIADETYDATAAEAIRKISDLTELNVFKLVLFSPSDRYWSRYGDIVIVAHAIGEGKINKIDNFKITDVAKNACLSGEVKCWYDACYGPRLHEYVYVIHFGISFDDAKNIEGRRVQLVFSGKTTSIPVVFEFPHIDESLEKEYSFYFKEVKSGNGGQQ